MTDWKPLCWYAGTTKCHGKLCMDSDEAAVRPGHPEATQSDPIEACRWLQIQWLKNRIYCQYLSRW